MPRPLFDSAFSWPLAILLALLTLWIRSHRIESVLALELPHGAAPWSEYWISSGSGCVWLCRDGWSENATDKARLSTRQVIARYPRFDALESGGHWYHLGLRFDEHPSEPYFRYRVQAVSIPYGYLLAIILTAAIWRGLNWHRARENFLANRCVVCGYSLTGNTSGVCPECGTAVPRKAETTG